MTLIAALDPNIVAVGGLIATVIGAIGSAVLVGPNRRKVVEETSSSATQRATSALEAALNRYTADNDRLRDDVDQLERTLDEVLPKLRAVEAERDQLARRIERMLERFSELGITAPT